MPCHKRDCALDRPACKWRWLERGHGRGRGQVGLTVLEWGVEHFWKMSAQEARYNRDWTANMQLLGHSASNKGSKPAYRRCTRCRCRCTLKGFRLCGISGRCSQEERERGENIMKFNGNISRKWLLTNMRSLSACTSTAFTSLPSSNWTNHAASRTGHARSATGRTKRRPMALDSGAIPIAN